MSASRTLRIALAVSLLMNVLVVGVVVGAAIRWQRGDVPRLAAVRPFARLRVAADSLQPENRRAYGQALRGVRRDAYPLIAASRAARRDAAEAFVAPTFDRPAIENALARARAADFALRGKVESAVLAVSERLALEERRKLGEGLKRSGPLQQSQAPTVKIDR